MVGSGLNWKGIVFWVFIACIVAFAIIYFLPLQNNPARNLITLIASKLNLPKIDLSSATTLLKNNWEVVTGIGVVAVPMGIAYVKSYLNNQKAKKELEAEKELSKLTTSKDAVEISNLKAKITEYESDTTNSELQKKILGFDKEKETWQNQLTTYSAQTENIHSMHAQFIEKLAAAADNQIVYDPLTKQNYKVLKLTNELKIVT